MPYQEQASSMTLRLSGLSSTMSTRAGRVEWICWFTSGFSCRVIHVALWNDGSWPQGRSLCVLGCVPSWYGFALLDFEVGQGVLQFFYEGGFDRFGEKAVKACLKGFFAVGAHGVGG